MLSSGLLNILAKLTPKEMRELGVFINSPFFNTNGNVVKLYNYVKKYHPEFKSKKLEKEYVFKKVYGTGKYNDGFMRANMFSLNSLAEEYLAYKFYKSNPVSRERYLLAELHKRNADALFERSLKKAEKLAEEKKNKDEFDLLDSYLLEYEKNSFTSTRYNIVTKEEDYFRETGILEKFFFVSLLRRYSYIVNKGMIVEVDSKLNLMDEALSFMESNDFEDIPVALVYYNNVMLMLKGEEVYYENLKKIVQGKVSLNKRDLYNTYIGLQNYAIRKVTEGHPKYALELFEIHQGMLLNDIFSMQQEGGYMSHTVYKNIVSNSLRLKKFNWTRRFINDYRNYLIPEHRENACNYALAKLCFEEGGFGQALEYMRKVNYEDLLYKIEIKIFMMKIYYELEMEEAIHEVIDSFRHFLSQKKLYSQLIESGANFNRIIKKILKLRSAASPGEIQALKSETESTKNMVARDWLLEKINQLPVS